MTIDRSQLNSFCFKLKNGKKENALNSFYILDLILQEDFAILEGQQRNLAKSKEMKLYLTPYELGVNHFHLKLKKDRGMM